MQGAETDISASNSTKELSFSIKKILQDKDDKRNECTISPTHQSSEEAFDCSQNSCENEELEKSEEKLLFLPWQIFGKQANRRIGHPYQSRATPKRKKPRTTFSRSQIQELEELFTEKKYLTSSERQRVASYLQLTDCQVKTWFQNRRTKWKRETDEEKEEQRHAMRRAMMSFHKERMIPFQNCL